jgi:MFS family permease
LPWLRAKAQPALLPIVIAAAMIGIFAGSYHPAASALMVDIVPPEQRVRAFAALRLAGNAGFACGSAAGGVLVNYSLFWLFAGDALTTVCYGVTRLSRLAARV